MKHKVLQVQRKQIDSHRVCLKCPPGRQMCVCVAYFPDFEPVLSQQKSQLRDVCGLPLPIDDQASQFLAKF